MVHAAQDNAAKGERSQEGFREGVVVERAGLKGEQMILRVHGKGRVERVEDVLG